MMTKAGNDENDGCVVVDLQVNPQDTLQRISSSPEEGSPKIDEVLSHKLHKRQKEKSLSSLSS